MVAGVLLQPVLVLNASWTAIATITVRHALELLVRDAAQAIQTENDATHSLQSWIGLGARPEDAAVATVRFRIRAPEVVVLRRYSGVPDPVLAFSRRRLLERDGHRCQYCGRATSSARLSVDHVLPRSRGGPASWENCVLACMPCNRRKGDRLPEEAGMRLLRRPRRPDWTALIRVPAERERSWNRFLRQGNGEANGNGQH